MAVKCQQQQLQRKSPNDREGFGADGSRDVDVNEAGWIEATGLFPSRGVDWVRRWRCSRRSCPALLISGAFLLQLFVVGFLFSDHVSRNLSRSALSLGRRVWTSRSPLVQHEHVALSSLAGAFSLGANHNSPPLASTANRPLHLSLPRQGIFNPRCAGLYTETTYLIARVPISASLPL
jgi:hypothetical protein